MLELVIIVKTADKNDFYTYHKNFHNHLLLILFIYCYHYHIQTIA